MPAEQKAERARRSGGRSAARSAARSSAMELPDERTLLERTADGVTIELDEPSTASCARAPATRSQSTPARAHARAMASIELDAGWWCSAACAFRASASLPIVLQLGELSYFQDGAGHVAVETVALSHTLDLCPLTQTTWDALHSEGSEQSALGEGPSVTLRE